MRYSVPGARDSGARKLSIAARTDMQRPVVALFCVLALGWGGAALADAKFEHLAIRVESNVTDKDFEIVVEATGGDTGLSTLKVSAPDGRVVIDFKAAPNTKLGIRSYRFETSEPKSLASLTSEYPAGVYTFTASTVTGMGFSGTATLSHNLPAVATFIRPRPDETNVPLSGLQVTWGAAKNVASYHVTIEDDATERKVVQAALAGDSTTLSVPDRLLAPGTRYKLAIGTVAKEGNAAFVETSFTTAKK
jgi:hypothetical protein